MISIVLVTYHSLDVLPNCMASLERCDVASDCEIVAVDNASTDGTFQWLEAYVARVQHPFVRVTCRQLDANHGYAFANNRALEIAQGDFLLLLNPDTVVVPNAISKVMSRLQENGRIGAAGCRLVLPDARLDRACRRSFPTLWNSLARLSGLSLLFPRVRPLSSYNLTYLDDRGSYEVDSLSGAFMLVPRRVYERVGDLDESYFMYGEDIDWCYRIKQDGYKVWYEGTVQVLHLKGGNGGKRSVASLRSFYDTMLVYYKKHHAKHYPAFVQTLLVVALNLLFYMHLFQTRIRHML